MSYRIEVTAGSLTELAGRLLELAAQFNTTVVMAPAFSSTGGNAEATEGKPKKSRAAKQDTAEAGATSASEAAEAAPDTAGNGTTATPAVSPSEPEPAAKPLDFHNDVAPLVIALVEAKGPSAIEAVLAEFGVARASQVPAEQHQELFDALTAALSA